MLNFVPAITFAVHLPAMEQQKNSRAIYWLLTLVSVTGMVFLFVFKPEWSWVSFPFVGTFLAGALDCI